MNRSSSYYRIYLLTVCKEAAQAAPDSETGPEAHRDSGWRFFLEDPRTGQRRGFTNAVDLVAILLTELGHGQEL
ncbi:MAG: hypothetical protein KDI79_27960 [Anaerolineae bacterium]|nr:hypothetical protein [Anaerolineae bacterium]